MLKFIFVFIFSLSIHCETVILFSSYNDDPVFKKAFDRIHELSELRHCSYKTYSQQDEDHGRKMFIQAKFNDEAVANRFIKFCDENQAMFDLSKNDVKVPFKRCKNYQRKLI